MTGWAPRYASGSCTNSLRTRRAPIDATVTGRPASIYSAHCRWPRTASAWRADSQHSAHKRALKLIDDKIAAVHALDLSPPEGCLSCH